MYMPGRSRTGSRPSRTVMSLAVYVASLMKKALQIPYLRAGGILPERAVVRGARETISGRFCDHLTELFVTDLSSECIGFRDVLHGGDDGLAGGALRGVLEGLRNRPRSECELGRGMLRE